MPQHRTRKQFGSEFIYPAINPIIGTRIFLENFTKGYRLITINKIADSHSNSLTIWLSNCCNRSCIWFITLNRNCKLITRTIGITGMKCKISYIVCIHWYYKFIIII